MPIMSPITQALYGQANAGFTPQANLEGMNAWMGGNPGATPGNNVNSQQSAIGLAAQTAAGKGPSAASDMLAAQTAKTQANTNALASSAPGRSQAEARRTAMLVGSNATQDLGAQAAAARSREQLSGESLYGQLSGEGRAQDIENAKLAEQAGMGQANLALGQNSLGLQASTTNAQMNQQTGAEMAGVAAAAMLAFADGDVGANPNADFVEPPGKTSRPAMVSLREITGPDANPMLIMVNQQTGKIQRVAGTDLTPEEMACVQRPHGAGPLDANSPNRQAKPMNDGDVGARPGEGTSGPMGFRAPQPMRPQAAPPPRKTFADVVREAHADLYTVPEGGRDPMGGGTFKSDENEPRTRRAASAGGNAVGSMFHDGDVPGEVNMLGPNAPVTDPSMMQNPRGYTPDPSAGISNMPSDSDVYYATASQIGRGEDKDWQRADQLAQHAPELQSRQPRATGGYDEGWDDVIRARGGSAPGDPPSPSSESSDGGSGPNFFKVLGSALAGYADPKNIGKLYGKQPEYAPPTYQDGDLNQQLDAAHKAGMTMGPVSVTREGQTTVSREGDDESPVTKSSPVAEQEKHGAYVPDVYPMPQANEENNAAVTDFASRDAQDPYRNLPRGPETSGTIGENSLLKNYVRANPSQFSPFIAHDDSGLPKHMATEARPAPPPQPKIPYDKRLPGTGFYSSTYMDGDVGDPFVASTSPAHDGGRDISWGQSARAAFDEDISRLRTRLDAEDAATRADKKVRAPSVDPTPTNAYYPKAKPPERLPANPYKDADLTSKFAARPSKKRSSKRAHASR